MSKQAIVSSFLPEEIWIQILIKLPIKSILICTGVCRSWKSLIKTPSFISSHLELSISEANNSEDGTPLSFFANLGLEPQQFSLRFDDEELTEYAPLTVPHRFSNSTLSIDGSCNGLVLVSEKYHPNSLFLWNPAIRKLVTLPALDIKWDLVGIGFDSSTNDYIVLVVYWELANAKIGLYSLKSNSWKRFNYVDHKLQFSRGERSMTFLNGIFHTPVCIGRSGSLILLGFDMCDGVFREIMLPNAWRKLSGDFVVNVRQGLLSVSFRSHGVLQIWVMKEYGVEESWTPVVNYALPSPVWPLVLGFRKNGDAIMSMRGQSQIALYDLKKSAFKYLEIRGEYDCYFVNSYVESLALLDKGVGFRDEGRIPDLNENLEESSSDCSSGERLKD